jgi:hypothetical protein
LAVLYAHGEGVEGHMFEPILLAFSALFVNLARCMSPDILCSSASQWSLEMTLSELFWNSGRWGSDDLVCNSEHDLITPNANLSGHVQGTAGILNTALADTLHGSLSAAFLVSPRRRAALADRFSERAGEIGSAHSAKEDDYIIGGFALLVLIAVCIACKSSERHMKDRKRSRLKQNQTRFLNDVPNNSVEKDVDVQKDSDSFPLISAQCSCWPHCNRHKWRAVCEELMLSIERN